jgi:hypothetical protein
VITAELRAEYERATETWERWLRLLGELAVETDQNRARLLAAAVAES